MVAAELLAELDRRGVSVLAQGGQLITNGPRGAIPEDLARQIRANRDGLLKLVRGGDTYDLLRRLRGLGVGVEADYQGLRLTFPHGTFTNELRDAIKGRKYSLLAILRGVTDGRAGFNITWIFDKEE